jgi:hypothetical protein
MDYDEKMKLDTWSKQTQTKPNLPALAGKFALSVVEGPMATKSRNLSKQLSASGGLTNKKSRGLAGFSKIRESLFYQSFSSLSFFHSAGFGPSIALRAGYARHRFLRAGLLVSWVGFIVGLF